METEFLLDVIQVIAAGTDIIRNAPVVLRLANNKVVKCIPFFKEIFRDFAQKKQDRLMAQIEVAKRLVNISKDKLDKPPKSLLEPCIRGIANNNDNKVVREMFIKLLAMSMNKDERDKIHPAFIKTVEQLSPDEAKIIKYMYNGFSTIPVITLNAKRTDGSYQNIIVDFTTVAEYAKCDLVDNILVYISNLLHLGILGHSSALASISNEKVYEGLKNHRWIVDLKRQIEQRSDGNNIPDFAEGYVYLTEYGKRFCEVCLAEN